MRDPKSAPRYYLVISCGFNDRSKPSEVSKGLGIEAMSHYEGSYLQVLVFREILLTMVVRRSRAPIVFASSINRRNVAGCMTDRCYWYIDCGMDEGRAILRLLHIAGGGTSGCSAGARDSLSESSLGQEWRAPR